MFDWWYPVWCTWGRIADNQESKPVPSLFEVAEVGKCPGAQKRSQSVAQSSTCWSTHLPIYCAMHASRLTTGVEGHW